MKKIAFLFLIVLLIALMAVPAFSAIEQPDRLDRILMMYDKVQVAYGGSWLANYPYYVVFAPEQYDGRYSFFFFDSPVPLLGSTFRYVTFNSPSDSAYLYGSYVLPSIDINSGSIKASMGGRGLTSYYIVEDFSTAKIPSFNLNSDRDFYINVLGSYVDIASLENLLDESQGLESDGYTPSSWSVFQAALQSALDLLEQPEYTQEQIDNAYDALLLARDSLVLLPDITELESLLSVCKAIPGDSYTLSSYSVLQSAIQDAEVVLALPEYTEQQVLDAYSVLESAYDSLVLLPDTSDLESLLTECKSISVDSYTAKSFAALQSAIKQAENLLAQLEYTESDLADAILLLQNAKDNLIELSVSDAALRQNLLLFVDILLSNIAVILPIGIIILGIILCVLLLPRILYKFFR